jgi:hypothetical protein
MGGVLVALVLSRRWPRDQAVRIVLGDTAPVVTDVAIRYGQADDWQREVTFHYAPGHAPRIVSHEPRLASGDYDVQVEIGRADGPAPRGALRITRHVTLDGNATSLDVSREAMAPAQEDPR